MQQQIYSEFRKAILDGTLKPGVRLCPSRVIAESLGIGRNTVIAAFERLNAEGFLETKHGTGTFVYRPLTPATPSLKSAPISIRLARDPGLSSRGVCISTVRTSSGNQERPVVPFRPSVPALDRFPFGIWNRLRATVAKETPACFGANTHPAGYAPLRQCIANYVALLRGVRCTWQQVIVTAGIQQGMDFAARILLDNNDRVLVEDPGFLGSQGALTAAGAQLVPVGVDSEGMQVDSTCSARMAVVTPSNHFPLGVTMSLRRRLELLAWAHARSAWVLEDDYDGEFRRIGVPISSLQGLDEGRNVIYMGTFSKTLFPGIRLGYLIVPERVIEPFLALRAVSDRHLPLLDQIVLAHFIEAGHFGRHLRRMRTLYAERYEAILESLSRYAKGMMMPQPNSGGMNIVVDLPSAWNDTMASNVLRAENIDAPALSSFRLQHKGRDALLLGYAAYDHRSMAATVRKMVRVLNTAMERAPHCHDGMSNK